jgi:uncharacterized protein YeeX (DUF496 family)
MKRLMPVNPKNLILGFLLPVLFATGLFAQQTDTAYNRVIIERAEKITKTLGLKEKKETKATEIVVDQYRQLSSIHDSYKTAVASAKQNTTDKAAQSLAVKAEDTKRDSLLKIQHTAFISQLSKVMNKEQVEKVKNGMTYNLVNVTYDAYVDMIPSLKEDERKQIKDWLIEARELAMDAGSSDGKHAVFGKYKGRINNYLSKQGYDSQKERVDWEARIKARKEAKTTN